MKQLNKMIFLVCFFLLEPRTTSFGRHRLKNFQRIGDRLLVPKTGEKLNPTTHPKVAICLPPRVGRADEYAGLIGYQAEKAQTAKESRFSLVIRIFRLKPGFPYIFLTFPSFCYVFLGFFSLVTLTTPEYGHLQPCSLGLWFSVGVSALASILFSVHVAACVPYSDVHSFDAMREKRCSQCDKKTNKHIKRTQNNSDVVFLNGWPLAAGILIF